MSSTDQKSKASEQKSSRQAAEDAVVKLEAIRDQRMVDAAQSRTDSLVGAIKEIAAENKVAASFRLEKATENRMATITAMQEIFTPSTSTKAPSEVSFLKTKIRILKVGSSKREKLVRELVAIVFKMPLVEVDDEFMEHVGLDELLLP